MLLEQAGRKSGLSENLLLYPEGQMGWQVKDLTRFEGNHAASQEPKETGSYYCPK